MRVRAAAATAVLAAAAAMRAAAAALLAVAAARVVRLAIVALGRARPAGVATAARRHVAAVDPGEHGGEEEEDGVHDAEGEGGLEHGAGFVGVDAEARAVVGAEDAEVEVVGRAGRDGDAVCVGDEAEVVDAGDEGADEGWWWGGGGG